MLRMEKPSAGLAGCVTDKQKSVVLSSVGYGFSNLRNASWAYWTMLRGKCGMCPASSEMVSVTPSNSFIS